MDLIENANDGIIQGTSIVEEMKKSYLEYAMSVIVSRALPDVRDGLKPVHRRILYSMFENGFDYNKPFKKSARIVGDVMAKYHPHGDAAIYDSLVRMAQDFSLGVPLIDGQGNFGSIDKDDPAAMRYTESRLQKISHYLLEDLPNNTVSFIPNYDGSEKEPSVLPARFPNLLINGSEGIAVGMATSIPPHNFTEVLSAVLAMIKNPEITIEELMEIVPAPDFPTGGLILANSGISSMFNTGRGSIKMRGRAEIEEGKNGRERIIITEIPYQVVKAYLVENIATLVKEKKIEGISEIRDESSREGIRIVIELKKDADSNVILNQLYKFTQLELNFSANMLALLNGRPQMTTLHSIIKYFIEFREEVITARTNYFLNKTKDKAHILIGLCVAVDFIDEVIKLIKSSVNTADAREKLLQKEWNADKVFSLISLVGDKRNEIRDQTFKFTEEQVKAILEMRLAKLTGLERDTIIKDLNALVHEINQLTELLTKRDVLIDLLYNEVLEIKEKFPCKRKSEIVYGLDDDVDMEDLIKKEDIVVSFTLRGYIKRDTLSSYDAQKRGGKGKFTMKTSEDDAVTHLFTATTHSFILFFSSMGRVYKLKGYKIPIGSNQSKGRALVNLLNLQVNEIITNFLVLPENKDDWSDLNLIFATSKGLIRRSSIDEFSSIPSNGKIAIGLGDDDSLVGVKLARNDQHILLASKNGKAVRFGIDTVRVIKSRSSSGVIGMVLEKNDIVVSIAIINEAEKDVTTREEYLSIPLDVRLQIPNLTDEELIKEIKKLEKEVNLDISIIRDWFACEEFLLTITENGYGKRTSTHEYRISGRGTKGVINILTTERNGKVVGSFAANDQNDVIASSSTGKVIRFKACDVSIIGKNSQGVKMIALEKGEKVITATVAVRVDEEDEIEEIQEQMNEIENQDQTSLFE
jgi:DNA gyrase subunit A